MRLFTHSLFALALAGSLAAQVWQPIATATAPATTPPATNVAEMVFDLARGRAVLFGGWAPTLGMAAMQTWEYDGASWTQNTTANSPPGRSQFGMAFDMSRGRTVVFGGLGPSFVPLGDTWEYDGVNWIKMSTPAAPQPRQSCQMVYDLVRGVCVLFGGTNGLPGTFYTDTWEWNGTSWTQVTTPAAPPGRQLTAMAYDPARGRTILFGGYGGGALGSVLNDTWEYDGTNWVQVTTANRPLARAFVEMTHDWTTGKTILFGGYNQFFTSMNDCWTYDGTDWTNISATTGSYQATVRDSHSMCYDVIRKAVVMYGGYHDLRETWELGSAGWPWTPFGTGCPGSAGIPALTLVAGSVPALGTTFSLDLANLPAGGGLAYMITGFSDTVWGGTPLPLALSPFGWPGCNLYVAPDPGTSGFLLHSGGSATWSKAVPNVPALQGLQFFNQALSVDGAAPNGKGAFSNAGRAVVQ